MILGIRKQMIFEGALLVAASAGLSGTLLGWSDNPIRVAGGLLLSMFAPGYALLKALYPRALSRAEMYGLSIPVSFVLSIVIGAMVDVTPVGLSGKAIVLLLWVCTIALMAVAYARAIRAPRPNLRRIGGRPVSLLPVGVGAVVLSVVLVEVAMVGAGASLAQASHTTPKPFTALSVDGANGVQQPGVPLGVTLDNEEGQTMQYDVQVMAGENELSRVDGVQLDSGQRYSLQLPILAEDDVAGADVIVYQSGETTPYRTVHVGPASER